VLAKRAVGSRKAASIGSGSTATDEAVVRPNHHVRRERIHIIRSCAYHRVAIPALVQGKPGFQPVLRIGLGGICRTATRSDQCDACRRSFRARFTQRRATTIHRGRFGSRRPSRPAAGLRDSLKKLRYNKPNPGRFAPGRGANVWHKAGTSPVGWVRGVRRRCVRRGVPLRQRRGCTGPGRHSRPFYDNNSGGSAGDGAAHGRPHHQANETGRGASQSSPSRCRKVGGKPMAG